MVPPNTAYVGEEKVQIKTWNYRVPLPCHYHLPMMGWSRFVSFQRKFCVWRLTILSVRTRVALGSSAFLTLIDSHDLPQTWLPQTREQPEMPKRKEVTNNLISLFEAIYSIHKVYGGMLIYLLLIFVVFCTYHHPFGVFSQPALGLFPRGCLYTAIQRLRHAERGRTQPPPEFWDVGTEPQHFS